MAEVNRYQNPANAEFINYYAPLPFNELFQVGTAMAGRADKARKDLAEYTEKYSKFRSPSQLDTQQYYDLTMGRIKPIVDNLVSNPDMIKTAEGRAQLAGAINAVDYASLSNLEQSRDAMLQRQELERQLSAKGQYNPYWHGIDYTNYDTSRAGIFDQLTLTPYQSIKESTDPYFNALKDSYLKKSNGVWTWTGVDMNALNDTAARNVNAYATSQVGQMHLKEAIARGWTTPEKAMDWLQEQMVQSNKEYLRENKTLDPLYELNMKLAAQRARAASSKSGKGTTDEDGFSKAQQINTTLNKKNIDMMLNDRITPSKGFSDYLTTLGKASENANKKYGAPIKFTKRVIDALKTQDTTQGMSNVMNILMSDGSLDEASANEIWNKFNNDRNSQIRNNIYADVSYANKLKLQEDPDLLRSYLGISLNNKTEERNNFDFTDAKGNRTIGTFGKIPASVLNGSVFITSNDKVMSEITADGLQINNKPASTSSGTALSFGLPAGASASAVRHGQNNISEKSDKMSNAVKKMSGVNTGITKYITSHANRFNNNIFFEPSNEISMIRTDNGDPISVMYGTLALPKKDMQQLLKEYSNEYNLDLSEKDILKVLLGDSFRDFKVMNEVKAKGYRVADTSRNAPEYTEDMLFMKVALPFLNDEGRNINMDNTYNKSKFGTTNAGKFLDYSLDYNFSPAARQNPEGLTPINFE